MGAADGEGGSSSTGASLQHETLQRTTRELQQSAESRRVLLLEKKISSSSEALSSVKTSTSRTLNSSSQEQMKPTLPSKTSTETQQTIKTTTPTSVIASSTLPPPSALSQVSKQPSTIPISHTSQGQIGESFVKKSKFTWIKNKNVGGVEPKQANSISSPTGKALSASPTTVSRVAGGSSPLVTVSKRTPAKKLPRKLSSVPVALRTSKYKWVSSSSGAQVKISRKSLSPKAVTLSQRAQEKGEAIKKVRTASIPPANLKQEIAGSSTSSTLSSRYCWKAGDQSTSPTVTGGAAVARRRSAFHWTSEKSNKGVRGLLVSYPSGTKRFALTPSSSPGGFKLCSRMKIIRKSVSG